MYHFSVETIYLQVVYNHQNYALTLRITGCNKRESLAKIARETLKIELGQLSDVPIILICGEGVLRGIA